MSDAPPPNGRKPPPSSWIGLLHVLSAQPAQFLLLAGLIVGLAWFVDREARHREAVYAPLLATCLRVLEPR